MEKFIIEAPSQPELLRSPSPTMSLPPSWKYDNNAYLSPMVSRRPSKSPCRPSKTPPASLYGNNLMESEVSQKELEISRHQPYQLQSSLFILSPSKGPARSIPQEVPPPRPSLPDSYPCPQGHQIPSKHLLEPKASRPGQAPCPVAASGEAQLVPPHTPKLHWGQGWDPRAKAAKTDLLSGKEFSGVQEMEICWQQSICSPWQNKEN
uniref:Uncharacterized protein n=1 Tax=Zonotrichia albicollis TaxID=44394 RepID=A0A8D2MVX2_ZONAL